MIILGMLAEEPISNHSSKMSKVLVNRSSRCTFALKYNRKETLKALTSEVLLISAFDRGIHLIFELWLLWL